MHLLVGLGNPGPAYVGQRHNAGFMAVERIIGRYPPGSADGFFAPWRDRFKGKCSEGRIGDDRVTALLPAVFMNLSGQSVRAAVDFFNLEVEQVMVVHDDLDLPLGALRVKRGGGTGGHNGLRSLDAHIGREYWRIRLGIGRPPPGRDAASYVLGNFTAAELQSLQQVLQLTAALFPLLLTDGAQAFSNAAARQLQPPPVKKEQA